ncbi:MAG: FG-GAP and VCBS repeat-containing protein [Myxococcota bacterium]
MIPLLAALAAGCDRQTVRVVIEADEAFIRSVRSLRLRVGSFDERRDAGVLRWPATLPVHQRSGSTGFQLVAEADTNGGVARLCAYTQYGDATRVLRLRFPSDCVGTCVRDCLDTVATDDPADSPVAAVCAHDFSTCERSLADGGPDAGTDGETDASSSIPAPQLLGPENGVATGAVRHAPSLRPLFRWAPVSGATSYRLEITDSPGAEFGGEQRSETVNEAMYQPPEPLAVATSRVVGRRYFWRVRSCDADGCGLPSSVWYVDVGRSRADLNGDGFDDLAIGAPRSCSGAGTPSAGNVIVHFGQAAIDAGFFSSSDQVLVSPTTPGSDLDDSFGAAVAAGDLDGDGVADLVVGAPDRDIDASRGDDRGRVFVYQGQPEGGLMLRQVLAPPAANNAPRARFGMSLALGDDDGDGDKEIFVGAPGEVCGAAYRFRFEEGFEFQGDRIDCTPGSTNFGWRMASADLDADGRSDLVVTSGFQPQASSDTASIVYATGDRTRIGPPGFFEAVAVARRARVPARVVLGATSVDIDVATLRSRPAVIGGQPFEGPDGGGFGLALAAGDLDGDGQDELVGSAPFLEATPPSNGVGRFWVFAASTGALLSSENVAGVVEGEGTSRPGYWSPRLGTGLTVLDLDGDGAAEVIASAEQGAEPDGSNPQDAPNVRVYRWDGGDLAESGRIFDFVPGGRPVLSLVNGIQYDELDFDVCTP